MAEIDDHLVPTEGLTNSFVEFIGLEKTTGESDVRLKFGFFDEDHDHVGSFWVDVAPQPEGTLDAMVAEGHRRMVDVLRQWLYEMDNMRKAYDAKA